MWTYSTNCMGPYANRWYEENNVPYEIIILNNKWTNFQDTEYKNYLEKYYGGRIDCYCSNTEDPDYDHFNQELYLPIMSAKSYGELSEWLETYKTKRLDLNVLKTYEEQTGNKLEIHRSESL